MKYLKYKLFWKSSENHKEIYVKKWNEYEIDYYAFVRSETDKGFHQVAVNSEMMLGLVSLAAQNLNCSLSQIDMMEEDGEMEEELSKLIAMTNSNRGVYATLIETLRNLVEESSLEIKRITFCNKKNDLYEDFFIQVNGLCGVSCENSDIEKKVVEYIERYMN